MAIAKPGHWVQLPSANDGIETMAEVVKKVPGIPGFQKRYRWKAIEPGNGDTKRYDFTEMFIDLNYAAQQGKQLSVLIEDKTFTGINNSIGDNPMPVDLAAYALRNNTGGYTSVRWEPTVVSRYNQLVSRINNRFESHPAFAGIAIQETALGLTDEQRTKYGYTPQKMADAYISNLQVANAAAPKCTSMFIFNFLAGVGGQQELYRVVQACAALKLIAGGPDCWPLSDVLNNTVYPLYPRMQALVPMSVGMSAPSYAQEIRAGKYMPLADIVKFAKEKLFVKFMFWSYLLAPQYEGAYSFKDAMLIINKSHGGVL